VVAGSNLTGGLDSRAFFHAVKRVLRRGGQMAYNVIGALRGPGPVQRLEHAARAELSAVRLVPVLDPGETYSACALRNVVILGGRDDGGTEH